MAEKSFQINKKKVLKYLFLPEIMPRLKELGGSGFGYLAFLIALVYQGVRILPANHIYTNPANIGKFGIRQVMAEAANKIVISRQNIDQILVFIAILAGLIILSLQLIVFIFGLVVNPAWANIAATGLFGTPNPEDDICFLILDRVFGIPDFFGSSANATIPTPFHLGLHGLFRFYNLALLVIGIVIFIYFIFVVIAETAQTGTPFGKRFNSIYAPLRLVAAIGLLIPLNHGLNASQYITLAVAKAGSGLATNAWTTFNRAMVSQDTTMTPIGVESRSLIARPESPDFSKVLEFLMLVNTCRAAYQILYGENELADGNLPENSGGDYIKPYLVKAGAAQLIQGGNFPYESAKGFYANAKSTGKSTPNGGPIYEDFEAVPGDLVIRWGVLDNEEYQNELGNVAPICGEMRVSVNAVSEYSEEGADGDYAGNLAGAEYIQNAYWSYVLGYYFSPGPRAFGDRFAMANHVRNSEAERCIHEGVLNNGATCDEDTADGYKPPADFAKMFYGFINGDIQSEVIQAHNIQRDNVDLSVIDEIVGRGWCGSGIWYNQIAEMNGAFSTAVFTIPSISSLPAIMNLVRKQRLKEKQSMSAETMFDPTADAGDDGTRELKLSSDDALNARAIWVARVLNDSYLYWNSGNNLNVGAETSGNGLLNIINSLFGTAGLFSVRDNDAQEVHPLAQLVHIGDGLMKSTVENLGYAMSTAFLGGLAHLLEDQVFPQALQSLSGMYVSLATVGLSAGFILFYIIPFLPFMYFFFAVGSWVKTIFEATLGAPLWALAHLRIDGDGFPGKSAGNGYMLLFEIFIRPILAVAGLISGMAIFGATISILHEIFDIVIENLAGFENPDKTIDIAGSLSVDRGAVDDLFFTIFYVVIVYMIATASFKMIDAIPKSIIRWFGSNTPSFIDQQDDATQGLVRYAGLGSNIVGGEVFSGMSKGSQAAGRLVSSAKDFVPTSKAK